MRPKTAKSQLRHHLVNPFRAGSSSLSQEITSVEGDARPETDRGYEADEATRGPKLASYSEIISMILSMMELLIG